ILADFLVEKPDENPPDTPVVETPPEPWTLFTDGSSCVDGSGAEYEALIAGLRKAAQMGMRNVQVTVDSKLVANQVLGTKIHIRGGSSDGDRRRGNDMNDPDNGVPERWDSPWPLQARYVIREIHEGSCSMHAVPRSVVAKAMRLGYYWPTMHWDAREMIPGPFPEGPGKVKFLIVAMDYFIKWIEAKAVATITGNQFSDNPFKDWCDKLNITQRFALMKHPQSNGLVDLGEGIKARLGEGNKN
ncbi:reverse transcriptase domain-containing protein, partial [Tanacetum coccineum]